jgi:hypothetical protein
VGDLTKRTAIGTAAVAAAVAVLAVLLIGSLIYLLASNPAPASTSSSSRTTGSQTTASCSESVSTPTSTQTELSNYTVVTKSQVPGFIMSPGSTMQLCVEYSSGFLNNTYDGPAYNSAYGWEQNGDLQPTNGTASSASPVNISIAVGQSVDVVYSVTAYSNATGFYGLTLFQHCAPFPIAVGYRASQVNSSDFPGLFGTRSCPAEFLQAQILGFSGATMVQVVNTARDVLTSGITNVSVSSFPTPQGAENVTFRMQVQSFSQPLSLGLSLNRSFFRSFYGNPGLIPASTCSWSPTNDSTLDQVNISKLQNEPASVIQINAPTLNLESYSDGSFTASLLVEPPVLQNSAVYVYLYTSSPGRPTLYLDFADYFPVSVGGQLQTVSGLCPSITD